MTSPADLLPPLLLGTATFNTQHVSNPLHMPYRQIVARALELGVTGFDTSPYYGLAEVLLGDALAAAAAPRDSYVLVTKAGRIAATEFDYSPTFIRYSVARSLERLHTDYLDLVYLHDVEFVSRDEVVSAIRTLRELRDEGKIKFVGISGFPVDVLCALAEDVVRETAEPLDAVLSYGYFTIQNPVLGRTDDDAPLRRFKNAGVRVVLNASMLGMGLLTQAGIPDAAPEGSATDKAGQIAKWHPAPPGLRRACRELGVIAAEHGETLEAVALRWSMEEYARVGAEAGLGVRLARGKDVKVGGTVMGVTRVEELEQTVKEWEEAATKLETEGGEKRSERGERLAAMVEGRMWPALGEWKDYAWKSPEEGFVNTRGDKMGTVPKEDELAKLLQVTPA